MSYDPLPSGTHIRLLKIRLDWLTRELVCKFKTVSLDRKPKYKAISYAWGDPTPVRTIKFSDGQSFPLSATLSDLFDSLRKSNDTSLVWIDALCINQKDDVEKAAQVSLMGRVYSSALQVLLWLGNSTQGTIDAFRFMQPKQKLSWPEDWEKLEDLSGLDSMFALLERPWFQRVWVIQEVILNDNVVMVCGDNLIDFDNFRICVFAVWKFAQDWSKYDDESPALRGLWCVTRLLFMRDEYQDSGAVRYEILLQAAYHCQATDKRDMVFAFKGIADKKILVPEPDYKVSIQDPNYSAAVEEVYTKTAIALLCHGASLDVLALGGIAVRKYSSNLPTWVPDLRHHSYSEPFVPCERLAWDTGGTLQVAPVVSQDQLRLQINPFDVVMAISIVFDSLSVIDQKSALREILAMREILPYTISEHDWLDKVAESLTFGLDIEDEPVELADYREDFNEWLAWLQSSSDQDDLQKITSNKYYRTIAPRVDGWKAFLTQRGFFCIGPPSVQERDMLCTAPGSRFPLVLRSDPKASDSEPLPECILVSWCFVHGLMHYGVYNNATTPQQKTVHILLR